MNFNISNLASLVFSVNKTTTPQKTTETKEFNISTSNNENLSNFNSKQIENLHTQISKTATNIMNNIQQNIFLRDMLGLPKEWTNLLNEFSINSTNSQLATILKNLNTQGTNTANASLLALLQSNAKVNLISLAEYLNKNSVLMADKLLKYMGTANMSQNNISQLKEIMLIGASIANSVQINPQEFIRDIIQMYLPWLPLVPPQDKDLNEIEAKTATKEKENSQILFYISTNSLGYFKIEIFLDTENEIYITNICEKENEELREIICTNIKENTKKISIKAKLFFSKKIENEELNLKDKQLYIVNSTDSLVGLTLIQLISRIIFELDEKQGQRIEKLKE